MKALSLVLALAVGLALSACTNVRERSLPANPALTNTCLQTCPAPAAPVCR